MENGTAHVHDDASPEGDEGGRARQERKARKGKRDVRISVTGDYSPDRFLAVLERASANGAAGARAELDAAYAENARLRTHTAKLEKRIRKILACLEKVAGTSAKAAFRTAKLEAEKQMAEADRAMWRDLFDRVGPGLKVAGTSLLKAAIPSLELPAMTDSGSVLAVLDMPGAKAVCRLVLRVFDDAEHGAHWGETLIMLEALAGPEDWRAILELVETVGAAVKDAP